MAFKTTLNNIPTLKKIESKEINTHTAKKIIFELTPDKKLKH